MDCKTHIILVHEFLQTVRRKSFIIMTLAFPVLALLGLGVYQIISGLDREAESTATISIGVVDQTGLFSGYTAQPGAALVPFDTDEAARQALIEEKVREYVIIPPDYLSRGMIARFSLEQELEMPPRAAAALRGFLLDNLLEDETAETRERAKSPLSVSSVRLDASGEVAANQGGFGAFVIPYLFAILLVMSIFSSSGFLLQGLSEEKQNRVMEVLLSSVSPTQLLTGKVLGLGAAGLVQILVWLATVAIVAPLASESIGGMLSTLEIPSGMLLIGLLYFVLGYLFFAMIMAGVGAVSTTPQEGQQLSTIFTLLAVSPFWAAPFIIENPGHIVAVILTFFPFTAPITVMTRLGLTSVPAWELAVSVVILIASIFGTLFIAARVLRAFLLMYGKRPALGEIMKALREA